MKRNFRSISPYDASILNTWARVPESMPELREQLLEILEQEGTEDGKAIGQALRDENADVSRHARTAAEVLRRAAPSR